MSEQWKNPPTEEVHLRNGKVIQAEVNGKTLDGQSGSIFNDGDPLDVELVKGQWQEKGYTPTPADEALYAQLLTVQVVGAIQQAYTDGKITDLETYNRLYEVARKADGQVRKLLDMLEQADTDPFSVSPGETDLETIEGHLQDLSERETGIPPEEL